MTNHNYQPTTYHNTQLETLIPKVDLAIKVAEFTNAIRVLAEIAFSGAKQLVPIVIGYTIEAVGCIIETAVERYSEVRGRIERMQIRQISDNFIKDMAQASMYAPLIANPMKQAACNKFLQKMERYWVQGVSLDELMTL